MSIGGMKLLIAAGVALLVGLAMVPALPATMNVLSASAAAGDPAAPPCAVSTLPSTVPTAGAAPDVQWAYGGQAWVNYSFSFENTSFTYNSSFAWAVVFTATPTTPGNWSLEEQRSVGILVQKHVVNPRGSASYCLDSQESDLAFANITNHSTVYVNAQPVAALGIVNASVSDSTHLVQTLSVTNASGTEQGSLKASATVQASVGFDPSLGLIPLNLTGVREWNSSSMATFGASWAFSYAYTELNGTSGSHSKTGSLSGTSPVNVTGLQFAPRHAFRDHQVREGVVLFVQGPFDSYDGFVLVPRSFDALGGAAPAYAPYRYGTAGISSEDLYVSAGPGGLAVTAADQTFASDDAVGVAPSPGVPGPAPQGSSAPGTTVLGQPVSVAEAQTIEHGFPGTFPAGSVGMGSIGPLLVLAVVGATLVAVGALGWRSLRRLR